MSLLKIEVDFQTRSLRGRQPFNCDLQQQHSAKFFSLFRVLRLFVVLLKATYAENLHIVLSSRYIKKRSFLTNCAF